MAQKPDVIFKPRKRSEAQAERDRATTNRIVTPTINYVAQKGGEEIGWFEDYHKALAFTTTHGGSVIPVNHATRAKDYVGFKPDTRHTRKQQQQQAFRPQTRIEIKGKGKTKTVNIEERQAKLDTLRAKAGDLTDRHITMSDFDTLNAQVLEKEKRRKMIEAAVAMEKKLQEKREEEEQFWLRVKRGLI